MADDGRYQGSAVVFVRDDDDVSVEVADHQISGPAGRC